jgi:Tfp pilus assembly protein PilN
LFKTLLGIEIAGNDLRVAVVRSSLGKLRLVQTHEMPAFLGLTADEQRGAIEKLVKEQGLTTGRVFLTLPRDHGVVRQLDFPVDVKDQLKSAVNLQLESLSPWATEEIYWDFALSQPAKGARSLRVTVAIIPKAVLDPWIDFFRSVRLPLSGASLSSLSSAHGAAVLWPNPGVTVMLGCEADYVEGSLVHDGRLYSVTNPGPEIAESARAAAERLMALGRITASQNARFLVHGALAGSVAEVEPFALPLDKASRTSSVRYGAVSAALLGLRKTGFETNLVPYALRYRTNQLQLIPTYVLAALAGLLVLLMIGREPYQLMVYASMIDQEIGRIAPAARQVADQQVELNQLSEKYRALSGHFTGRDYNLEAIRELARVLPPSAWVASYTSQDRTVTLTGFADSATELQRLLEDHPLFKEVQFTTAVTRDARGKDRFVLKATIEAAQ